MQSIVKLLRSGDHSLVISHSILECFDGKGVSDLYRILSTRPEILDGALVADRVIGKGAAALMILGRVRCVYGCVVSESAVNLFKSYGISCTAAEIVPSIINRQGTDICPVEKICLPCATAEECLVEIKQFLNR